MEILSKSLYLATNCVKIHQNMLYCYILNIIELMHIILIRIIRTIITVKQVKLWNFTLKKSAVKCFNVKRMKIEYEKLIY